MKNEYLSAVQGCLSGDKGEWREGCLYGRGRVQGNWILTKCVFRFNSTAVFSSSFNIYIEINFSELTLRRPLSWEFFFKFPAKRAILFIQYFLHVCINVLCYELYHLCVFGCSYSTNTHTHLHTHIRFLFMLSSEGGGASRWQSIALTVELCQYLDSTVEL